MSKQRHTAAAGAAVTAAVMVLTACGSDGSQQQSSNNVQPAGDSSSLAPGYDGSEGSNGNGNDSGNGDTEPGKGKKAEPAGELALRDVDGLGDVVTDSAGMTLYRFDEDTADPPKSTCEGDCAKAWPVVSADDASAAEGIDSDKLGQVQRSDGTSQLTLNGWPVYRYAKDKKPGDANGQGAQGTWYALTADGGKAQKGGNEGGGAEGAELSAIEDPELGTIVADAEGRTLYRFDKDSAWPMKSNCDAKCQETWKPAKIVDKNAVKGVAKDDIIVFDRPDGTKQLTIDCWPLYWYTGDKKPGDTKGHGVGGTWHAVTPDGKRAKAKDGGAPADSGDEGGKDAAGEGDSAVAGS